MDGWLSFAGSGPLTWMHSNATWIEWMNRAQPKTRQHQPRRTRRKDDAVQTADLIREKYNENQTD